MVIPNDSGTAMIQGVVAPSSTSLQISNLFTKLIPFVYPINVTEHDEDCPAPPLEEDTLEEGERFKEIEDANHNDPVGYTLSSI